MPPATPAPLWARLIQFWSACCRLSCPGSALERSSTPLVTGVPGQPSCHWYTFPSGPWSTFMPVRYGSSPGCVPLMNHSLTWAFEYWLGLNPVNASTVACTTLPGFWKLSMAHAACLLAPGRRSTPLVTSVMIADHSGAVTSSDASGVRPGVETAELSLFPAHVP